MTTESTDWLTRHVRAKREAENIGEGEGYPFMTWKDAQSLEPFFGEGAKVVGHGLLVAKGGQTLAFMRLLSADGGGAATGGAPAPSAPSAPAPAPASPPSSGPGAHAGEGGGPKPGNPLKDPGDSNSYLNDTGKKIINALSGFISPSGDLSRFGNDISATGNQVNGLKRE